MNKEMFIIKLIKSNSLCNYKKGSYVLKSISEWTGGDWFDLDLTQAEFFSSFNSAEKYIKNNCGAGFTFEIIKLIPEEIKVVKN